MTKTCNACGGAVCEVCGGCIPHGECSCAQEQNRKCVDDLERIKKVLLKHDLFDLWRYPDLPQAIDFLCGKAERALQAHGVINIERVRLGYENTSLKEEIVRLNARNYKVCKALSDLYDACMQADGEGELYYTINGDLLDAARKAMRDETQRRKTERTGPGQAPEARNGGDTQRLLSLRRPAGMVGKRTETGAQ